MKRTTVFGIASLFSEVLPRDIFFYMVKTNLSYLDLKKLYRAFPTLAKSMKSLEEIPDDRYWIERPLLTEGRTDVTELIAFVLKPNRWADCEIVVSGSYVLYALEYDGLSEPGWKYNDIDVFITVGEHSESTGKMIEDVFEKFEKTPIYGHIARSYDSEDSILFSKRMKRLLMCFHRGLFMGTKANSLTQDVEFDFGGIVVHLIFAWKEMHGSAKDAVNEFDISICRNSYDGKKMEILCEEDIAEKVFRTHRLIECEGEHYRNVAMRIWSRARQIKKYEERGYVEVK